MPVNNKFTAAIKKVVTASADNAIELCFYDTIQNPEYFDWSTMQMEEGDLVGDIISQVKAYAPSKIHLEIDCLGGDLFKAISIYNFLKDYPAKIECKIMGFCASAATVLACAANPGKLIMPASGYFITHASSTWGVGGTSKEIRDAADANDRLTRTMAEILASRNTAGHTADEIIALWDNGDCWMDGTQAKTYGFVDDCYNETSVVTARLEEAAKMYTNAPKITAEVPEKDSIITKIETAMKSFSEMVTAALAKIGSSKVTAKVEGATAPIDVTADVTAALQPVLAELAASMQAEVTAEIATVTEKITALETANAALKDANDKLIADVTAMAGAESRPGAKTTASAEGRKEKKHFGNVATA